MKRKLMIFMLAGIITLSSCGHEHEFTEASCLEPKICSACEETEGEPLGHTTDMGLCERCGEKCGFDEYTGLLSDVVAITDHLDSATDCSAKANNADDWDELLELMEKSEMYAKDAYDALRAFSQKLEKYDEFSGVKAKIDKTTVTGSPMLTGTDITDVTSFIESYNTFITNASESLAEFTAVSRDLFGIEG